MTSFTRTYDVRIALKVDAQKSQIRLVPDHHHTDNYASDYQTELACYIEVNKIILTRIFPRVL